jgi:surface protein
MFEGAVSFNQNISSIQNTPIWNTENVTNMSYMFYNADKFNGDISGWNTGKVTNMTSMFDNAFSFNQDISGWNTENVLYVFPKREQNIRKRRLRTTAGSVHDNVKKYRQKLDTYLNML